MAVRGFLTGFAIGFALAGLVALAHSRANFAAAMFGLSVASAIAAFLWRR